ncbi:DNA-directed RNA polymerase I subunit RPA12 [Nematocida homosporus]|uniref:DNA-directed RNA polymerase I subunit RPA12 n=1 Tax=Nematocida homosporus TaxID=1912981 RepID=UPI00221F1699|nr:DNA-directed RNA polymerase I subunit RPA12 [Nematocida homosporus]KAI5185201.1 DNA-directed RNA polymerase I subunit RPA12 [Nematocida homosporus]
MFCTSCERYLSPLDQTCSFCSTKCQRYTTRNAMQYKTFTAVATTEKKKGAKIKESCPQCKSEYMYYYTMQLRSADEGQTVFYECDCGYKTKLNT